MEIFSKVRERLQRLMVADQFLRRMVLLAGGTACGQAITVVSAPLLTRIYTTADFGHFQAFLSVLAVISTISSLRYETAILLPEPASAAASLTILSGFTTVVAAAITAVLLLVVRAFPGGADNVLIGSGALWILPLSVLGGGWNQVATYWCIREGEYSKIARMKIVQGVAQVITQLGLGGAHIGGVGLLLGNAFGRTAGTTNIVRATWRTRAEMFRAAAKWPQVVSNALRYRSFPLVATPATLLNSAALAATPLLVGWCFGASTLGLYGLVERSLGITAVLIGQAASQVYMNSAARLAVTDPDELAALFLRTAKRLATLGALPCLLVMMVGPSLFPLVFGAGWRQAGMFARIMAPYAYAGFIVSPLIPTLVILEHQSWQLLWDATRFALVVATFVAIHKLGGGPIAAIAANSVVMTAMYFAHAIVSYRGILHRRVELLEGVQEGVLA